MINCSVYCQFCVDFYAKNVLQKKLFKRDVIAVREIQTSATDIQEREKYERKSESDQ